MTTFAIKDDFLLDGKPFQIISGALHYFRVFPEHWEDRLQKMKMFGCNAVETYVAWNAHEPEEGKFDFDGQLDLVRFIKTAERIGLYVILRPSPYICAEWDFGGLPAWLNTHRDMRYRCSDKSFQFFADRFIDQVVGEVKNLQCTRGGPIIMMQVENEYGAYGNDHAYLQHMADRYKAAGVDVPLFTSDQANDQMMTGGQVKGVFMTANFDKEATACFKVLRRYQPTGPLMVMEFWSGWFDHWQGKHYQQDPERLAAQFEEVLQNNASINIYMFHGGTNFGFTNGANWKRQGYEPTVTSYDYGALLSEAGDVTEGFRACRRVLERYVKLPPFTEPTPSPKLSIPAVILDKEASLLSSIDRLASAIQSLHPISMEMVGQSSGFILYRTRLNVASERAELEIFDVHDRALIFIDQKYIDTVYIRDEPRVISLSIPAGGAVLDILVENMGRVNYGPRLGEEKGITKGVQINEQYQFNWEIYPLPLDNIQALSYDSRRESQGPTFLKGSFEVAEPADTFLDMRGWGKGVCFVNNFNLGRYWEVGPTHTLYVPGPILRSGSNEVVVFELHKPNRSTVDFIDHAILG